MSLVFRLQYFLQFVLFRYPHIGLCLHDSISARNVFYSCKPSVRLLSHFLFAPSFLWPHVWWPSSLSPLSSPFSTCAFWRPLWGRKASAAMATTTAKKETATRSAWRWRKRTGTATEKASRRWTETASKTAGLLWRTGKIEKRDKLISCARAFDSLFFSFQFVMFVFFTNDRRFFFRA